MFDTQKVLYINEAQVMILAVSDSAQEAQALLREQDLPLRRSHALSETLRECLGSSSERCKSLLALIDGTLRDITKDPRWSVFLFGCTVSLRKPIEIPSTRRHIVHTNATYSILRNLDGRA